jgi:hypothetical protein
MTGRGAGAFVASLQQLREIGPLTTRILGTAVVMTLPATFYVWSVTESTPLLGLLFSSIAGLGFYLTSDRLRDEPQTTSNVDFDEVSGYQRRLVIFINVYYLNMVVVFGTLIGAYVGTQILALAGFAAFLYPPFDYWLGHKRWWLSPGVLVAGSPAYLPYIIGGIRSQVARRLSLEGTLRERGGSVMEYIDPEAFNFELLEVDQLGRASQ